MGIGIGLMALYAASRVKAGNDIREKEKQARIPVQYVETAGGDIVERDKDDPIHNNLTTRYTRVGDKMITATDKAEDIVVDPKTNTQMTTDQYRSNVLAQVNEGNQMDFGAVNANQVVIPPVIGQRKRFSGQFTPKATVKKSSNTIEQVGGIIDGKAVFKNTINDYITASGGKLPTLKQDVNVESKAVTNRGKLDLEEKVTAGKSPNYQFKMPSFTRTFKNKDLKDEDVTITIGAISKNVGGQVREIHNQLDQHAKYFSTLKMNDAPVVSARNSLLGLLKTDLTKLQDPDGNTLDVKQYESVDRYLKAFPNFRKIPGLAAMLARVADQITEEELQEKLNEKNASEKDKTESIGVVQKSSDKTVSFVAEVPVEFTKPEVINGKNFPPIAQVLTETFGSKDNSKFENNGVLEVLTEYEYDRDPTTGEETGIKMVNGKKITKPVDEQYKINFFRDTRTSVVAGPTGNQFKLFNAVVQPDYQLKDAPKDYQILANKYANQIGGLPNGYQEGKLVIATALRGGPAKFAGNGTRIQNEIFSEIAKQLPYRMDQKNAQNYLADSKNKTSYSAQTIQLMKRYKGTYFLNGKPLDISTAVGNVYLAADGFLYWYDKATEMVGRLVDSANMDSDAVYGSLAKDPIQLNEQSLLDQIGNFDNKSGRGYTRSKVGQNDVLFKQRQDDMRQIAKELSSSNSQERLLAQRKYYRMMIAYQMAAAIQGGTGGRTISDQDVDNILKALGGASASSTPEAEIAGIDAALTLMQEIYQFNKDLSNTPETRYIALKHQEFMIRGNPMGVVKTPLTYDIAHVTNAIYTARGTGPTGKGEPESIKVSDQDLLDAINGTAAFEGKSYTTLKEAEEAGVDIVQQRKLIQLRS